MSLIQTGVGIETDGIDTSQVSIILTDFGIDTNAVSLIQTDLVLTQIQCHLYRLILV